MIALGKSKHLGAGDQDASAPLHELHSPECNAIVEVSEGHREEVAGFLLAVEQSVDLLWCGGVQFSGGAVHV
jgi:hypothetical protein